MQAAPPTVTGMSQSYGPNSQHGVCPSCHASIKTSTKRKANSRTHLWALIFCCCLCWPCVCCPYCVDSCNNINHYCPNCNAFLGTYSS